MEVQYFESIKNLSVYSIIKLLSKKFIKDISRNYIRKCEKSLISVAYEVILRRNYAALDWSVEELQAALLMEACAMQSNKKILDRNKYDMLDDLLERLKCLSTDSCNPFDVLKILTLLHSTTQSSQNLNNLESSHTAVPLLRCNSTAKDELNTKSCLDLKTKADLPKLKPMELYGVKKFTKNKTTVLTIDLNVEKFMSGESCINRRVYVPRKELRNHVMSALVGIQSTSFRLQGGCMMLKHGLYTDGLDPNTLADLMEPVLLSSCCYQRLNMLQIEMSLASISPFFRHFLGLYHRVVLNLPEDLCVTSWIQYLSPLAQQIESFTTSLVLHPYTSQLLEKLYYFTMNNFTQPFLSVMFHTFLMECCQAYFDLLDSWIFEGIWKKGIFIQKNNELDDITSKEAWEASFNFLKGDAPNFLPCLDVYNCGKTVAFLKLCSENDQFYNKIFARPGRPRIKLCSNLEELKKQQNEFIAYMDFVEYNWYIWHLKKISADENLPVDPLMSPKNDNDLDDHFQADSAGINMFEIEDSKSSSDDTNFYKIYKRSESSGMEAAGSLETVFSQEILSEVDQYGEELYKRFKYLSDDIDKRRKFLLWKQSRNKLISTRKQFLKVLYSPAYKGDICHFMSPPNFTNDYNKFSTPKTIDANQQTDFVNTCADVCQISSSNSSDVATGSEVWVNNSGEQTVLEISKESSPEIQNQTAIDIKQPFSDECLPCKKDLRHTSDKYSDEVFVEGNEEDLLSFSSDPMLRCVNELDTFYGEQSSSVNDQESINPFLKQRTSDECMPLSFSKENDTQEVKEDNDTQGVKEDDDIQGVKEDDDIQEVKEDNDTQGVKEDEELNLENLQLQAKDIFRIPNPLLDNAMKEYKSYHTYAMHSGKYIEEIVPLREMITNSLIVPLKIQHKFINNALLRVFMDEKKFLHYAEKLMNYFFLVDGMFTSLLIDHLCIAVEEESPRKLLHCKRLTQILDKATCRLDKNVSFRINYIPDAFELNSPTIFSCISLTYNIEWPLKFLITPKMITKYDTVFAFLICFERTFWMLKNLFLNLKINSIDIQGPQYRQLQLQRFIMMQFVCSLKSYVQNVVVFENWKKFLRDIHSFQDIENVYRTHVNFVKKVRFLCFLGENGSKLKDKIMRLQEIILIYCRIAAIGEWSLSDSNVFTHAKFAKLNHYFELFLQIARYITKYVEKLVEHHQEEVDGLLQFLILNSFYLSV